MIAPGVTYIHWNVSHVCASTANTQINTSISFSLRLFYMRQDFGRMQGKKKLLSAEDHPRAPSS